MTDQHQQALLESSTAYVRAKRAFTAAVRDARNAGIDDEEISRITGLTRDQVRRAATS
jgi:alkylhydroperoxidase family enzyme